MKIVWGNMFKNARLYDLDGELYLIADNGMFDVRKEIIPAVEEAIDVMSPGSDIKTVCENKFFAVHAIGQIARYGGEFANRIGAPVETAKLLLAFLTIVDLCKGHDALRRVFA